MLPPDVLHDLKAAAAQVRHQALVYVEHGFARKYPRGRGISLLLSGPSGIGKTMAAEVIANDLGLDLYRIDLSARRFQIYRRDREEFARRVRCRRGKWRGSAVR